VTEAMIREDSENQENFKKLDASNPTGEKKANAKVSQADSKGKGKTRK
jgi:hypothetical protein